MNTVFKRGPVRVGMMLACAGLLFISCNERGAGVAASSSTVSSGGVGAGSASEAGSVVSVGAGGAGAVAAAIDYCTDCSAPQASGQLQNAAIDEASGLLVSRKHAGVYYVHNDSGDSARFFAINAAGATLGEYHLPNVSAVDWEDSAIGPCDQGSCLYIGDIGDNPENRNSYTIYRVAEPEVVEAGVHQVEYEAFVYQYPDGSHNAETLLVMPDSGELYVVTKVSIGPSLLFRYPLPWRSGEVVVLSKMGSVKPPVGLDYLTAGDIHPSGHGVLLRSYTHLLYYPLSEGNVAAALEAQPCAVPVNWEQQGETVAWSVDGKGYLTVSEGAGSSLYHVSCAAP